MPKSKQLYDIVTLRLRPQQKVALDRAAAKAGMTLTNYVRVALGFPPEIPAARNDLKKNGRA